MAGVGAGLLFYIGLFTVMWYARHIHVGEPEDEIVGLERDLGQWKRQKEDIPQKGDTALLLGKEQCPLFYRFRFLCG